MKKIFVGLFVALSLGKCFALGPPLVSVILSTGATQRGGFHTSTGTVDSLIVSTITAPNVTVSSISATVSNITANANLTLTGAASGDTFRTLKIQNTDTGYTTIISSSNATSLQMLSGGSGTSGNFVTGIPNAGLGAYSGTGRIILDASTTMYINTESDNPIIMRENNTEKLNIYGSSTVSNNPVYFPNGTLAAPSQTFASSTTAGRYLAAAGDMRDSVGKQDVVIYASTGVLTKATFGGSTVGPGWVGEVFSTKTAAATNFGANNQYSDVVSTAVTAGNWLITIFVDIATNTAVVTDLQFGIGTAAGNSGTGLVTGDTLAPAPLLPLNGRDTGGAMSWVTSVTSTTTYYLKVFAAYSSGPPRANGRMTAIRLP